MKLKRIKSIDKGRLETLIERYYEGVTTVQEEKELHSMLNHPSVAGEYEAERAMLSYFKTEKTADKTLSFNWLSRAAVVAVVAVSGFFAVQFLTMPAVASYAYVNGTRITNREQIQTTAMASLANLPSSEELVNEKLSEVNTGELIESQLSLFEGME